MAGDFIYIKKIMKGIREMSGKRGAVIVVAFCAILTALLFLLNFQVFRILSGFEEAGKSPEAAAPVADGSGVRPRAPESEPSGARDNGTGEISGKITGRTKIDDFVAPSLWIGAQNESKDAGCLTVSSKNGDARVFRKFDGFLNLQKYIYVEMNISGRKSIKWLSMYLVEDINEANYFECDLLPAAREGANVFSLNKKDFNVGSGLPAWNGISAIKFAFGTKDNEFSAITISEIGTYDASPLCSIWFDDGWKTAYSVAYPAMKEKGFKGTLSVVSSQVGYPAFCGESELRQMYDYGWDLVNHTEGHKDLTALSAYEVERQISACREYLDSRGFTRASDNFVPPMCATNEKVDEIIREYAATSRVYGNDDNNLPVMDPYHLRYREVFSYIEPETVERWIDDAAQYHQWLILLFHTLGDSAESTTSYPTGNFNAIIDYLYGQREKIRVVTVSEALKAGSVQEAQTSPAVNAGAGSGWVLEWEDGFNGGAIDAGSWNIVSAAPYKNNELQTYRASNVSVSDGCLRIISSVEKKKYYSGQVSTENKKLFKYGKIEIRAKLPSGKGIFPAFWLVPQSGRRYPEIDIVEYLGKEPGSIWNVFHYPTPGGHETCFYQVKGKRFDTRFHVYTIEWLPGSLKWFIDGAETFSVKNHVPDEKMFLIINTAVGGDWPGDPGNSKKFPRRMLIDYVRYYKNGV